MNVLFPLLFLAVLLAMVIFLWLLFKPNRPSNKNKYEDYKNPAPALFQEELSEELSLPQVIWPEQPRYLPEPELAHHYGQDRLVLLARDPHCLYTYWELTAASQEQFIKNYGEESWLAGYPVLRVYDITGLDFNGSNALAYTDIHINEGTDNWYVQVEKPDHKFCVDLGRILPDGRFITLLRSNFATTPRASLSERMDEEWMWIEGLYRSIGKFQFGTSSPLIVEELALRSANLPLGISSTGFPQKEQN